jgi:CBS domain containing-hemolysin-like protein
LLPIVSFLFALFFLLGTFFVTAFGSAFREIHKKEALRQLLASGKLFFYRPLHLYFFPGSDEDSLLFAAICGQSLARYGYIASALLFLFSTPIFQSAFGLAGGVPSDFSLFWMLLTSVAFILFSFIFGEYFPRILGMRDPEKVVQYFAPFSSIFLCLAFPLTFLFLKLSRFFGSMQFGNLNEPERLAKQEIIDIIHEAELSTGINRQDKRLIESALSFRNRIAREVMVPRVDVFSLPAATSIKTAADLIATEGYSRTPIYRNSVDEIVGVVMYKDILNKYREYEKSGNDLKVLQAPIESIQKNVLYIPETKKISNLLQEFRKKQMHFAIIVDEYGGTEGIVTIEDILEEIVGEIEDEYDEEEVLYKRQADGSWIVDARMSIFDAEELMGIDIPQEGDYDTIGGYVFHCAGMIPSKGFVIHRDEFEMEILASNERVVETVKIKPVKRIRP